MKLSIISLAVMSVFVSAAPTAPPKEVLAAIADGTLKPACTTYCYPAGGTTQCYCF
ncbi:hypothetical protein B0T16DRAFT_405422 [Cercophora newfieldiana]|uniref:Uncharacterized protein n=1 Tax=Cercophora newfieldiana TaxID=92897 RepID=A0AA40CUQ1_9PEZI|nr:hypothetical protein B0T16DRAFT_405422 [Cercophora newfieldiana]